ncbi:hypothetical protein DPMN_170145 [Dreissena polymorpha]|uniref:Uncharacterized protein n=1 Tax=Dreissena polymorpha TaxID=45954 RepID=A0A9D4DVN9_DREPO|nr:hypothetical protein DPMN_170145 [Dreissena polymorpha]
MRKVTVLTTLWALIMYEGAFSHPARPLLPECVERGSKGNDVDLICNIANNQYLDYDNIRLFTQNLNNGGKFNVTITCQTGGLVRMPWPFNAKNVVSIQISGCETVGYMSEALLDSQFPKELKYVSVVDVTHRIMLKELYDIMINLERLTADYECGQIQAFVQIYKNVQYSFPPPSNSLEEIAMLEQLMGTDIIQSLLSRARVCTFPNLNYLEESGKTSLSSFHFKIIESNALYPELKSLKFTNNSLHKVPEELRNLNIHFMPKLSYLDLSDNDITKPDFTFSGRDRLPLLVNLQRNKIQVIDSASLNLLTAYLNIVFDIRANPLRCSCELIKYGEHLLNRVASKAAKDVYQELRCSFQNGLVEEQRLISDRGIKERICNGLP